MQIIKFETKKPPIKLTRFIGYTPVTCLTSLKTTKLSPWISHDDSCFCSFYEVACLYRHYHKQVLTERKVIDFSERNQ